MLQKSLLSAFIYTTLGYGFVNVEPPVINEAKGIKAEISTSAKYSEGNSNTRSIGLATRGEYHQKMWMYYLIGSYTYGESNQKKDTNNGLVHLRYIHSISDIPYDYEYFVQTEFNEFQEIQNRNLIGTNLRRSFETYFDKFYTGLGLFYSYMKPSTPSPLNPIYTRVRLNTYLSFVKQITDHFSITYLGYYQPNIKVFSDYRISQTMQFNTSLSKKLILAFDIQHEFNATPYEGVEKTDIRSTINLRYQFK